jgi:hypothetical protein
MAKKRKGAKWHYPNRGGEKGTKPTELLIRSAKKLGTILKYRATHKVGKNAKPTKLLEKNAVRLGHLLIARAKKGDKVAKNFLK